MISHGRCIISKMLSQRYTLRITIVYIGYLAFNCQRTCFQAQPAWNKIIYSRVVSHILKF